jgi:signal transduction histidine kinase
LLPDYRIYTDKKRLMQVVTNFINNALKFTSEGQILLEYHPVEGTGQIEFSVTDTGMGIAPDAVVTVFDRFVKLNTFAKGTGLGLSICKSIIEHLGGTIGAESELGVGSRFWFRHPEQYPYRCPSQKTLSDRYLPPDDIPKGSALHW